MPTYSLINNGDSGLSVRTTLNSLLGDINSGIYIGPTGASGTSGSSGTSGVSGSSGTSGIGVAGSSGTSGTSPNQTLEQTLSLGNDVGTYSITGNTFSVRADELCTIRAGSFAEVIARDASVSGSGYNEVIIQTEKFYITADFGAYLTDTTITSPTILALDANDKIVGTTSTSGTSGSSGTSGTSGAAGSSGTSGVSGGGTTSNIVNVATASNQPTKYRVWSGNVAQPGSGVNNTYFIHLASGVISSNRGQTEIRLYEGGQIEVGNTQVYVGDLSANIGPYSQVLGRGHNNNNNSGNTLLGYASVVQSGPRECFVFGNSATIPNNLGHSYGEMTALFGFGISAKMRGALNIPKLHIQQLPGLTNSGSTGTASGYGFKSDDDFYTNYQSFNGTSPSGATFGSVYCDENGYMKIAGKGGVPMVNYAGLSFSDDASAAAAGVPLGGFYHTGGTLKVRIT